LKALPRISQLTPPSLAHIEAELDGIEALGAHLVASSEPDYPPLLAQLDAPPPLIALRGDVNLLRKPTIAIVGSREASASALLFAERLAADLGAAGFTVVSGLARGLDASAHKGSLATGTGAVLAGGLDHPYPPQNLKLHETICARGVVVSEAPLGTIARARFSAAQFDHFRTVARRRHHRSSAALRLADHSTRRRRSRTRRHGRPRIAARPARPRVECADQTGRDID